MIMKYEWGIYSFPIPAETVGKRCEELEKKHNTLTKAILLDSARDETDELHCLFEWDDQKAAEGYRLHQAGKVISSLKVTVIQDENDTAQEPVKAFVQIGPEDKKALYMNATAALSDETTRERVLQIALNELTTFQTKYARLAELAKVMEAIEQVKKEIG